MRLHKPSPSMAVALVALVFSMTGTGIAAEHYLITSKSQIKPSVLAQLKGNRGSTGAQGTNGAQGLPGQSVVGTEGRAGISVQGPEGKSGASGSKGEVGLTGTTGPQGPEGKTGPTGLTGAKGEVGATGAQGPAGPKGEMGAAGPEGKESPMPRSFLLESEHPGGAWSLPITYKKPVTLASHEINAGESYIIDATVGAHANRGAEGGSHSIIFYQCWVQLGSKRREPIETLNMGKVGEQHETYFFVLHADVSGPGLVSIQCEWEGGHTSTFEYEEETTEEGPGEVGILPGSGTGMQVAPSLP